MKKIFFLLHCWVLLSVLSGCGGKEQDLTDIDNMVMEDDVLDQTPGGPDPFFTPQEIVIKELPDSQAIEVQR